MKENCTFYLIEATLKIVVDKTQANKKSVVFCYGREKRARWYDKQSGLLKVYCEQLHVLANSS